MPRICFEHPEIDKWYEKEQEGTSTFDVCNHCISMEGELAEDIGLENHGYNGDPIPADAVSVVIEGLEDERLEELDHHGLPMSMCASCDEYLTVDNYYL